MNCVNAIVLCKVNQQRLSDILSVEISTETRKKNSKMAEESSMQINLTTTTYKSDEKPKKRKVVVSEDDSAEIAKSPEKKKSRRIQNGNKQLKHIFTHQTFINVMKSSIGLGFLKPTLRLRCWDVTSFCMQLGNREDSLQNWGERACYLAVKTGKGRGKKHLSFGVLTLIRP